MSPERVKIDPMLVDLFLDTWEQYRSEYLGLWDINRGWCYQFALVIYQVYGGTLQTPGFGHAWVKISGLDYDCVNLNGTDLKPRWGEPRPEYEDLEEFCSQWSNVGNSGRVDWDVIEQTVAEYQKLSGLELMEA